VDGRTEPYVVLSDSGATKYGRSEYALNTLNAIFYDFIPLHYFSSMEFALFRS
jgi:hypothetical protein